MINDLKLTLCFDDDSILVSKAVIKRLGNPKQIQMLINDKDKLLVLRPCDVVDRDALVVPTIVSGPFAMSGRVLLKRIKKTNAWDDDAPRIVCGEYHASHNFVLFDLSKAEKAKNEPPLLECGQ